MGDGTTSVVIIAAELLKNAAELVKQKILVKGTKARTAASIILRGFSDMYTDEMERSIHDALCVIKVRLSLTSRTCTNIGISVSPGVKVRGGG